MRAIAILTAVLFVLAGCMEYPFPDEDEDEEPVTLEHEEIHLRGVGTLSGGRINEVVVRSQADYDRLIYEYFQVPLIDYCASWFPEIRRRLEATPGLSVEEKMRIMDAECIPRAAVFAGLENWQPPEIDFAASTLLGQFVSAGGCRVEFDGSVVLDARNRTCTFHIRTVSYGHCLADRSRLFWVLIPRIGSDVDVVFDQRHEDRDEPGD
jgi:hypothetical protein